MKLNNISGKVHLWPSWALPLNLLSCRPSQWCVSEHNENLQSLKYGKSSFSDMHTHSCVILVEFRLVFQSYKVPSAALQSLLSVDPRRHSSWMWTWPRSSSHWTLHSFWVGNDSFSLGMTTEYLFCDWIIVVLLYSLFSKCMFFHMEMQHLLILQHLIRVFFYFDNWEVL